MSYRRDLNLNIESNVFTAGSAAEIVNAILEFLLYQRNQIPFIYKTFKYYVHAWDSDEAPSGEGSSTVHGFHIDLHRKQAKETKNAISNLQELIRNSFEENAIKCVRFLFGSTVFTAKEAYTIHIPATAIERRHSHVHHRISHAQLGKTLLSLLSNQELYDIFSINLCPTNIFLEFEMTTEMHKLNVVNKAQIFSKTCCKLPVRCKDIHFHLMLEKSTDFNEALMQCCKDLEVFGGLDESLQIDDECLQQIDEAASIEEAVKFAWWESEIVIRGFKDKLIKGKSIWSKNL